MSDRIHETGQAIHNIHAAIDCLRYAARDQEGKDLLAPEWREIEAAIDRLRAFLRYELAPHVSNQEAA